MVTAAQRANAMPLMNKDIPVTDGEEDECSRGRGLVPFPTLDRGHASNEEHSPTLPALAGLRYHGQSSSRYAVDLEVYAIVRHYYWDEAMMAVTNVAVVTPLLV